jgi:peroxiredoxin
MENDGSGKKKLFLSALVILIVLLAVGYAVMSKPTSTRIISTGDTAPEFKLPDTGGRLVGLSDFRGRVVMVHFWATWCPPCVEELPSIARFSQQLDGNDFVMLAVSVDEGGAEAVTTFLQKNGLSVPALLDPDRAVAGRYGTFKFPETYIVDRKGVVRYKVIGPRDWSAPEAARIVRSLITS